MGLLSTMKTVCHKLAGVAKNKTLLAIGAIMAGASAFAEGGAADYAIVAKDQSGAITFAPEKLVNPVVASAPVTKSSYDLPDHKPKKRKKYYKLVSYLPTALFFDNGLTIRQKEYLAYDEKQYFVTGFDRNFIYCKLNGKDCTLATTGLELPEDEDSKETRKRKVGSGSLEGFNASGQSFGQVGQVGQVKTEFQR